MEWEAARLRLLAASAVSKSQDLKQVWVPDPNETIKQRGGIENPATTFPEYCEMAANKSFYADGYLLQALALKLKKDLAIFGNTMNIDGKGTCLKELLKENKRILK